MGKFQCNGGRAIVPIFTESDEDPSLPELLGSGVLASFGSKSFLLTAAHVLEAKKPGNSLLVPSSLGRMAVVNGPGMTSIAPDGERQSDRFDCAWIELNPELAAAISQSHSFLGPDDIAIDDSSSPTDHYCLTGYPTCRSRIDTTKESVKVTLLNFNGYAASDKAYRKSKTNPTTHVAAQYSKGKSINSRGVRTRNDNPHGLSGGALWKWIRLSDNKTELRFLSGIIVEWDEQNAVVIGTKVAFLIESIRTKFPELSSHLPTSNTLSITCVEDQA
jgi:hypothetical protein